ncbi:MAG: DUF6323 family protein [Eubacteriales bacterium]
MNGLISFENLALQPVSREILDLNKVSQEYGLVLNEEEARELSDTRNTALTENERVETGVGAVAKIIRRFCTSHYITQENYTYVLNEVTYLFYYIKTETDDQISDEDLIDELFSRFELRCRGSVDTLENVEAERIIRKVNSGEHYFEWYADRDELDYDARTGLRDAPKESVDEAYGNDYFADDTPADHDRYEDEEDYDYDRDDVFDVDAFDEFYDRDRAENDDRNDYENPDAAHEYDDDDDYSYLNEEDDDDE